MKLYKNVMENEFAQKPYKYFTNKYSSISHITYNTSDFKK